MILHLLLFSVIPVITSSPASVGANCSRVCKGSSQDIPVRFPFGFSEGCEVRLHCADTGEFRIRNYTVLNLTRDNILISFPANCDRRFEELRNLRHHNYALTRQNGLVLGNCSERLNNCVISSNTVGGYFNILNCGLMNNSLNCYSDDSDGDVEFMNLAKLEMAGCRVLYSSITVVSNRNPKSPLSMGFQSAELGWWVEGDCHCHQNAICKDISINNARVGYRCYCNERYDGDGFLNGDGCRREYGFGTKPPTVAIVVSILGSVIVCLILALYIAWRKKKRSPKSRQVSMQAREENYTNESINKDTELSAFRLSMIANATNNFALNNKLGEGGFGPVYRGVLEDGREIAVKRLSETSTQGHDEFKNEIGCIAKLQHRNLVKLLGYCIQGDERMLIYEYMANKSLDFFIFDTSRSFMLGWPLCFRIINGIAQGLLYLHQDSHLRIIHRDLKASNILLDKDMNPKISDFGLARRFSGYETEANTSKVVGTYGYISPEYAVHGLFSVKSDVYSFGVLVLEIVSGKKNRGFFQEHNDTLIGHAWKLHKDGKPLELVSTSLRQSCVASQVIRAIHISLLCVQHHAEDRPTMSSVVSMLGHETYLPPPKQPTFFTEEKLPECNSMPSAPTLASVDEVTITLLNAR